jgi:RND family efflux transporter MFP subunit
MALRVTLVLLVALAALAAWGIVTRTRALAEVTRETEELAVTKVAVVHPTIGAAQEEIVLPGTVQPFAEAPILARTNGYVKKWYADLGARVASGQLLAEIDTPEVDQELAQARADAGTAEANLRLAQATANRYEELMKTDSASRQDYDNAKGNFEARKAAAESARFNVKRLEQLTDFKQIRAPFDGVITARGVDAGALVGTGTGAKELFHLASTSQLRVFINVPQQYTPATKTGLAAYLTLPELPGKRFDGKVVRTSQSIEATSRTLLVEIDVDNRSGELLPGSYVQAHFTLAERQHTVRLPVNALLFRTDGAQVATVDHDGRVHLQNVSIQRDLGTELEVASGLASDEQVIVNPPDSIAEGQHVRIVQAARADGSK